MTNVCQLYSNKIGKHNYQVGLDWSVRVGIVRMGEVNYWNLWKKEKLIPEPRHFFEKDLQCSSYLLQVINSSFSQEKKKKKWESVNFVLPFSNSTPIMYFG